MPQACFISILMEGSPTEGGPDSQARDHIALTLHMVLTITLAKPIFA